MTTYSLYSVKKFLQNTYCFFLITIILPSSSFSEINIYKIKNKIHVLNIHGKRFFLSEYKIW